VQGSGCEVEDRISLVRFTKASVTLQLSLSLSLSQGLGLRTASALCALQKRALQSERCALYTASTASALCASQKRALPSRVEGLGFKTASALCALQKHQPYALYKRERYRISLVRFTKASVDLLQHILQDLQAQTLVAGEVEDRISLVRFTKASVALQRVAEEGLLPAPLLAGFLMSEVPL